MISPALPVVRLFPSDCVELFKNIDRKTQVSWRIQAVEAIMPFWLKAISVCADETGMDRDKSIQLQSYAQAVPGWCCKWQDGDKIVKARVKELWKPTSIVWNAALTKAVRDLTVAPMIRNMHGVITGLLHAASDERNDPSLLGLAYDLAFLRTRFPFDSTDLMHFSRATDLEGCSEWDRVPMIYAQAAKELQKVEEMQAVFDETLIVVESFGKLPRLDANSFDWAAKDQGDWYRLRSAAMRTFHEK